MYQQGSLTQFASFSPKSYLAAAAESESTKQTLHYSIVTNINVSVLRDDPLLRQFWSATVIGAFYIIFHRLW